MSLFRHPKTTAIVRNLSCIKDTRSCEVTHRRCAGGGAGGRKRANRRDTLFGYAVGPHSWKNFLHPSRLRLWRAEKDGNGVAIHRDAEPSTPFAFIGVRSCDLHAIRIQDRVFLGGPYADPHYHARREGAFL